MKCPKYFLGLCSDEQCRENPYSYPCLIRSSQFIPPLSLHSSSPSPSSSCLVAKKKGKVSIRQPLPNIEDIVSHTPRIPHVPYIPAADVDVDDSSSDYSTERPVEMVGSIWFVSLIYLSIKHFSVSLTPGTSNQIRGKNLTFSGEGKLFPRGSYFWYFPGKC